MENVQVENGNALSRLRALLPSLSPAERKVGEFTLDKPKKVLQMTLLDIAAQTGVSNATAVRFYQSLRYDSWLSFKLALVKSLPNSPKLIVKRVTKKDSELEIVHKVFDASQQALEDTLEIIDGDKFDRAVKLLQKARLILIAGVGTSGPVAHEFFNRLIRLGFNCAVQTDSYLQVMQSALLGPKDVLFVISQTGESSDPRRTVQEAKKAGATVICLTGNALSPLAQDADLVFISATQDVMPETLSSRIAQYAMVHAFYVCLAVKNSDKFIENERTIWNALVNKAAYQSPVK